MIAGRLADLKRGSNQYEKVDGSKDPSTESPCEDSRTSQSVHAAAAALSIGTASVKRAKTVIKSGDASLIKDEKSYRVGVDL